MCLKMKLNYIYPKNVSLTKFTPLNEVLHLGKKCDKSGHCCSFSGGFVLDSDLDKLANHLKISKEKLINDYLDEQVSFNTKHYKLKSKKSSKPFGPCVFLGENKLCTIHEVKPLHCRVGSCCQQNGQQLSIWFALNHFVNPNDADSIRQWAIYAKTHPIISGGELHELVLDKDKLKKMLEYKQL
jgi:Fe-S-cluster containining protein